MLNFKKELIQLLQLPLNSSHSDVHAACLVKLTTAPKKRAKTAKQGNTPTAKKVKDA